MKKSFTAPTPHMGPKKMSAPKGGAMKTPTAKAPPTLAAVKAPGVVPSVSPDPMMKNMGSIQPPTGLPPQGKPKRMKYR